MFVKLQAVITEAELQLVPEDLRSKLDDHLQKLDHLLEDLKNENAELVAVNERQQFQFEKEISESHAEQKSSAENCLNLKNQISELETSLSAVQNELRELQKSHGTTSVELQSFKRNNELLQDEKKLLGEQLEKRRDEIDKLNVELKRLQEETRAAIDEKCTFMTSAEEAKMHESSLQHQLHRVEQEKSLLEQQVSDLIDELAQKNREIHVMKKEKSSMVLELQSKLELRTDEVNLLEGQVASFKDSCAQKDKRIENLAEKIRTLNVTSGQMEEHFQLELNAHMKLVDLYKKASEDNQKRVQELAGAFEEAKKLLQESSEARIELERNAEIAEAELKGKIQELEKENSDLKEELKHANDICKGKVFTPESLEALFPTAAATSKVMRSGMTLTQMYSEYVKALEEIQQLKMENQKTSDQLKQVVAEIEENTPVINEKMQEYQKALETISCLRTKLGSSLTDFDKLQNELNDSKRIKSQLERENNRLKCQTKDMSRQIQVMLKELQDAKVGMYKVSKEDEEIVSSSDGKTADTVITRHLVTFRDIAELQTKNQQLLAVVRDLSEQQEQQEKKIVEEKTVEFKKELKIALSQLEEMKEKRKKQAELVQSVIRQRDMYRVLLANQGYSESFLGSPQGSLSANKSAVSPGIRNDENRHALQQLQSEFDVYRTEKVENEKLLNKQLDKVRTDLSDLRVENAKLKSQLEYAEERVTLLHSNMENYKKEAAFLREKNQKHSSMIIQHQLTIQNLKQELMEAHENIAKKNVALENLKSERDIFKGVEKRLLQEKESLFREQQQKSQILANLQTVQNNLERIESETKRNLQYQLEKSEKENSTLKAKLSSADEEYKSAIAVWEKHTKELQRKIDAEVEKNRKLHEDLVDAYSRVHSTSQELSAVKVALSTSAVSAEKKPADTAAAKAKTSQQQHVQLQQQQSTELKNLKEQLTEAQARIKELQEQLDISKKSAEHYTKICNDLEFRVQELDEINKQIKDSMDNSINAQTATVSSLEESLKELEKKNRDLIGENVRVAEEKNTKIQELEAQVTALKSKISADKDSVEMALSTANQARADCLAQKKLSEETEGKYNRELMLHAENVKTLAELKEQHELCNQKIEELARADKESKEALDAHKSSWSQQEAMLLKEQQALKDRIADLDSQNKNLLDELELIGTQMAALKSVSSGEIPCIPPDIDLKDTQHLLQIIQYIKKEKEIINTQYDSAQSENIRLKMKMEQMKSDLEESKKDLKEIQDVSQTRAFTDAQHAELLRKIEMLNLLTESNNLLRMEKEKLVESNKELESKYAELEEKNKPLNEKIKSLQAQIEFASSENAALKKEVTVWTSRTNQLLEQSHRIGPQEYKLLIKEMEELKSQKSRLTEELQRKQGEMVQANSNIQSLKKEADDIRADLQGKNKKIEKLNEEMAANNKTMLQVKKIGRKYKTQYDELKTLYDALEAKTKAAESASRDSSMLELQKKFEETEKVMKDLKVEADKQKETAISVQKQYDIHKKLSMEKEEKAKKLLAQVRQRYNQINSQREVLEKEKRLLSNALEEVRGQVNTLNRNAGEESVRTAAVKSEFDSRITSLEKELKAVKEGKETLERQYEEMCQKLVQQKQTSKPTAVGGIVDRGSGSSEPLTANIKPLSTPAQASGPGLRHAASPSPRSTPTASIRPMAIGTVGASTSSQARMAAVLPTTVTVSTGAPTSDDSAVPQAAVQPTPATATVAPTTIAVTVTPSSHTPVISEVAPTSGAIETTQITQSSGSSDPIPAILITSVPCVTPHATALVSPRVEGIDTSESVTLDSPAPTTSVIVSPPATQTQMVQPTVKRPREESQTPSESPENSVAAKRVRMVSEGIQTNQQSSMISSPPVTSLPVATVVSRAKIEPSVVSEVHKTMPVVSSSSSITMPVVQPSTSGIQSSVKSEPMAAVVNKDEVEREEKDNAPAEWESVEDSKPEGELEIMEEDSQATEQMEVFGRESEIEIVQPREEEDMVEDSGDAEEIAEPATGSPAEVIGDVLDDESDNPMDADNLQPTASGDQCMAPPSFPVTLQVSDNASVPESIIGTGTSVSQSRRTPLSARVPMRQEHFPSTGRQLLTPFTIPDQPARFEEGDDSIVPSTPTLFVPRRTDGFAEAVSSPHVPPVRFLFSSSDSSPTQQGLSQLASQGALGVDDTRMDLSQFDDGSGRTVPSTPQQVSPSEAAVPDVSSEVVVTVEHVSIEQTSDSTVPVVAVAPALEQEQSSIQQIDDNKQQSGDLEGSNIPQVTEDADKETKDVPDEKITEEIDQPGASTQNLESAPLAADGSDLVKKDVEQQHLTESQLPVQSAASQSVRKPIIWEEPEKPSPSAQPTSTPSTSATTSASPANTHPPGQYIAAQRKETPKESAPRGQRARRMRYRGGNNASGNSSANMGAQRGSWTPRRGRGGYRRGPRLF